MKSKDIKKVVQKRNERLAKQQRSAQFAGHKVRAVVLIGQLGTAPVEVVDAVALAEKRRKNRERHWKRTGVSSSTVQWMKDRGML